MFNNVMEFAKNKKYLKVLFSDVINNYLNIQEFLDISKNKFYKDKMKLMNQIRKNEKINSLLFFLVAENKKNIEYENYKTELEKNYSTRQIRRHKKLINRLNYYKNSFAETDAQETVMKLFSELLQKNRYENMYIYTHSKFGGKEHEDKKHPHYDTYKKMLQGNFLTQPQLKKVLEIKQTIKDTKEIQKYANKMMLKNLIYEDSVQ